MRFLGGAEATRCDSSQGQSQRPKRRAVAHTALALGLGFGGACGGEGSTGARVGGGSASDATAPVDGSGASDPSSHAPSAEQLALWRATCPESMMKPLGRWPLPPPPLLSERRDALVSAGPIAMPKIGDAPEVGGKLQRERGSTLAADLGLKPNSCDPQPIVALHELHQSHEEIYCAVAFAYDECGQLESAWEWTKRRVADFPKSGDAALGLAIRRLTALYPDPASGLAINDQRSLDESIAIATQALADLDAATALGAGPDIVHVWSARALSFRSMAWQAADPDTPLGLLQSLLARSDLQEAHLRLAAFEKASGMSDCTPDRTGPCIPPPPLTEAEAQEDAALWAKLLAEPTPK